MRIKFLLIMIGVCAISGSPAAWAKRSAQIAKPSPSVLAAPTQIDPAGLCRAAVARLLVSWGNATDNLSMDVAAASEGSYIVRIDDKSRTEPWRRPIAHADCQAGRKEDGQIRVEDVRLNYIPDPAQTCLQTLAQLPGTSSGPVVGLPPDNRGIYAGLSVGRGRCQLAINPDGSYQVVGGSIVP